MLISLNLDWIRRDWWIWVMYYCSPVALIVVVRRWSLLLVVDMIWSKRGHPALHGLGSSAVYYCTMSLSLTYGPRDHRVHLSVKKSRCSDWDLNPPCPALHFTADVLCWKQRRKKRNSFFQALGIPPLSQASMVNPTSPMLLHWLLLCLCLQFWEIIKPQLARQGNIKEVVIRALPETKEQKVTRLGSLFPLACTMFNF